MYASASCCSVHKVDYTKTLIRVGPMTKLKLRDLISLNTMAVLSAVVLCVILATDPSLLG